MPFTFYIFIILTLLLSIIVHEVSHGMTADFLGDPTAKRAGRLTLNPLKHLDPIGSVLVPLALLLMMKFTGGGIIFGWAKPVPINPRNFRDQKYGSAKVSLAGPASNLLIALVFGLTLRFIPALSGLSLGLMFSLIVYINILLAVFNLLPIPPLDGSKILFTFLPSTVKMRRIKMMLQQYGMFILIFILVLLPGLIFSFINFFLNGIYRLIVGSPLGF